MTRLRVGKVILLEAYFWWTRVKCADRLISSDINWGLFRGSVRDTPLFILLFGNGGGRGEGCTLTIFFVQ